MKPLIKVDRLKKYYARGRDIVYSVDDISVEIHAGETLGLVGESGCGKSTFARCLTHLTDITSGSIEFDGQSIEEFSRRQLKRYRRELGMIFQDPYSSLNPRMNASDLIGEPLDIHQILRGGAKERRIHELLELVGLPKQSSSRFPHEFSSGQRQRIGIARALAANPRFIICDEPVSAVDVSVQARIINLFKKFQKEMQLTYLFISHDLRVVKYLSTNVAVMYLGQIMEMAPTKELFDNPHHPYTKALLSAIPILDPEAERTRQRIKLKGEASGSMNHSKGCPFAARCVHATHECHHVRPKLREVAKGHKAACHLLPIVKD